MGKYSDLALQQFVDSSTDIRWCPFPDCDFAVCMRRSKEKEVEEDEEGVSGGAAIVSTKKMTPGENVECGQGHGFCWYVLVCVCGVGERGGCVINTC